MTIGNSFHKKESTNTGLAGSMTVEAAFTVPFFIFCVINLLFGLQVIETASRLNAAMHETGNQICSYGYAIENGIDEGLPADAASVWYAAGSVAKHLGAAADRRGGIKGGISGITYLGSSIMTENGIVKISASYNLKFPVNMGIKGFRLGTIYYGHAWTGYDGNGNTDDLQEDDPIVYITPHGTVYHTDIHCSHLNTSLQGIGVSDVDGKRNKDGAKYYACEICGAGVGIGTVYITDYGNRYHSDINCSGLKTNVSAVHLSETGGRRACMTCGG